MKRRFIEDVADVDKYVLFLASLLIRGLHALINKLDD
jgi:hypothetical protein